MKLEELFQKAEARLFALGRRLFGADDPQQFAESLPSTPESPARAHTSARSDLPPVVDTAAACRAELEKARGERREVEERVARNEVEASLFPSRIQSSFDRGKRAQAVRQALELDSLRATLAADRVRLALLEQRCWSLEFRIRQLGRKSRRPSPPALSQDGPRRNRPARF